jgi:hypothetical protein
VFVNNHIFASPGILSRGNDEVNLAAVVEFVLQYSDGYVSSLCIRFIASVISYFTKRRIENSFLLDPRYFVAYIGGISHQTERESTSHNQQIDSSRKLSAVLEILRAVMLLIQKTQEIFRNDKDLRRVLQEIRLRVVCPEDLVNSDSSIPSIRCITALLDTIDRLMVSCDLYPLSGKENNCKGCLCKPVLRNVIKSC